MFESSLHDVKIYIQCYSLAIVRQCLWFFSTTSNFPINGIRVLIQFNERA